MPDVALQGPRSVGKSTVLNEIARQHAATVVNLDLPDVRRAVASDRRRYVRQHGTVFIDEYEIDAASGSAVLLESFTTVSSRMV
mgnify:CR=1 FL=1